MEQRPLGSTGIAVSEIGLGAWQLANTADWLLDDVGEALRVVRRALDDGCTFFDTAPGYGGGRSEEILGRALREVRPGAIICTKFSNGTPEGQTNFAVEAIRPTLEASLRRLRTDYVDVLLLHNPPSDLLDGARAPHYEVLERLKEEGKLRVYGASIDHAAELRTLIETTRSGAAEVYFNAFHQEMRSAFPLAQARGVGLIVKVPLDSGWLSGRYSGESHFIDTRARWSAVDIARRDKLFEQFAALIPSGISPTHAALQFVLAQPEVSTVIPGAKNAEQAGENNAAAAARLPDEVVRAMEALWEREIAADPLPW